MNPVMGMEMCDVTMGQIDAFLFYHQTMCLKLFAEEALLNV